MRRYSLKRAVPAVCAAASTALLVYFSLRQLLLHGRFFAIHFPVSRFDRPLSWLPLAAFLFIFALLTLVLLRAFARKDVSEFMRPGLYHYYHTDKFGAKRIHLRVELDQSAILMVDAYKVVYLNRTASVMAKHYLDGYSVQDASERLASHYRLSRSRMRRDYDSLLERLRLLIERDDLCPFTFFEIEPIAAFQTPVSAPYRLDLVLTYRCNIDCSHCYNQRRESPELTTSQWKKVLKTLWDQGIPHVDFTGGEPTLRPDLGDLVEYAEDLGMITGLLTNGVNLAEPAAVARLKEAGLDYAQVTLESHLAEVHNRMVRSDTFERTVRAIRNLVAARIHVLTNSTITRENFAPFEAMVPFLHGLGVRSFAVNSVINAGRSRHQSFGFAEAELLPLLNRLREKALALGMKFTWYTPTQYCQLNPVESDLGVKQCTAGKYNLAVEPDGTVIPCQSFYRPLGNILTDRWQDIYDSEFLVSLRGREWVMERCRGCEWLSTCGGGCPLQAKEDAFCCPDLASNP